MPKYITTDGRTFDVPENEKNGFELAFPDAKVEYEDNGEVFHVPISDIDGFLEEAPNATFSKPKVNPVVEGVPAVPMAENFSVAPTPSVKPKESPFGINANIPTVAETALPNQSVEPITEFGEGVKEGGKQLVAGAEFAAGETLRPIVGTSEDDKAALERIESLEKEGKDVAKNVQSTVTISPAMALGLKVFGPKGSSDFVRTMEKTAEANIAAQKALKEADGNVEQAKSILEEKANKQTIADTMRKDAERKMAEARPTKEWGWVGSMIPQMVGTGVGLGMTAVTKNPMWAQTIGLGNMAGLTTSAAGSAMAEARQSGASNAEVWTAGLLNGVIENVSERFALGKYTKGLFNAAKKSGSQAVKKAVSEVDSPARKELADLLQKANKQLDGKLLSGKNVEDYLADIMDESLSEGVAEGLQTITPMLYQNPDKYPSLFEIVYEVSNNALEGIKGGLFMGSVLGGLSKSAEHRMNRARRKAQGFVDVAEVINPNGTRTVVEVVKDDNGEDAYVEDGKYVPLKSQEIGRREQFKFDDFERGQFQNEQDESYDTGKTLETTQEMKDANTMLQKTEAEVRRLWGDDAGDANIDEILGDNPLEFARKEYEKDEEAGQTILDYLNAKATVGGIIDAARERISNEATKAEAVIDYRKNKSDGMIHPATLKNGDRQVYVVSGDIVTFDDGVVNTQKSSDAIIVQDAVTGKAEYLSSKDLLRAEKAINPEDEKKKVRATIGERIATDVENKLNGVLAFNLNDTYEVLNPQGERTTVQVVSDNGDGTINVIMGDAAEPIKVTKNAVQTMADNLNSQRADEMLQGRNEMLQSEKLQKEAEQMVVPTATETPAEAAPAPRVVPTTKDGKPDFNAMDAEMFVEEYASRYGEENTAKIARKNIAVEREKIAKLDKKIDDVTDPNQIDALYEQRQASEAVVNRYNEILERLGLDNTPELPSLDTIEEETPISEGEYAEMEQQAQAEEQADYDAMMEENPPAEEDMTDEVLNDSLASEKRELQNKIQDWLTPENVSWAEGKDLSDSIEKFGNEVEPIAILPDILKEYFPDVSSLYLYSGKGYLIDHAANHHPELAADEYNKIQEVLDFYDDIKDLSTSNTKKIAFVKMLDKGFAVVTELAEKDGKIMLHKTFFYKDAQGKRVPYKNKPSLLKKSSVDGSTTISPAETAAGRHRNISALDASESKDNAIQNEKQEISQENAEPSGEKTTPAILSEEEYVDAELIKLKPDEMSMEDWEYSDEYVDAYNKAVDAYPNYIKSLADSGALQEAFDKGTLGEQIAIRKNIQTAGFEVTDLIDTGKGKKSKAKKTRGQELMENLGLTEKEDARRKPLRERASMWEDKVGVKVNLIEDFEDIPTDAAKRAIDEGQRVTGWVVNGEVFLYMPYIANRTEVDKTYLHEVVAHVGMKELLGKDGYKAFCERVFNEVMTDAEREFYRNYPNVENEAQAADEFIAHISEDVELNASAWQKIVRFFKDALRAMGVDIHLTNADIQDLLRESYLNLAEQNGAADINEKEGKAMFSIRTYKEGGKAQLGKFLDNQVKKNRITKEEAKEIADILDEMYKTAVKYKDKYAPFGAWSEAKVVENKDGMPAFSVIKKNGDYSMNLDFSTVCKKRRTLDAVFSEMIQRGLMSNLDLDGEQIAEINNIIRRFGFETACALCFVDAKRFRVAQVADKFCEMWNPMAVMTNKQLKGIIKEEGDTVRSKVAKYLLDNPNNRIQLKRENFIDSHGFEEMEINNPEILSLYKQAQGTSLAKIPFGDVQYLNDLEKKHQWTPDKAYAVGGVRLQSFSDYVPRMFFDYMQLMADLSAKNLPVHAYTKEPIFAKQFGLTGMKINLSLVPKVVDGGVAAGLDADGNYAWMEGKTFPYEEAMALQNAEGYRENCGTIAVGVSDAHIEKLLDDPNIRMVIPYHKSGLNPLVAKKNRINEFVDYTNVQNTRSAEGTKLNSEDLAGMPNFNAVMHYEGVNARQAAQAYLDWCDSKGYLPKFDKWRNHPNYYKLLEDFTTIVPDANGVESIYPQGAVSMTFPTEDSAFGSIESLIREGLEEDAVLEGRRDANVGKIVDTIEKELVQFRFIGEKGAANIDKAEEATIRLDNLAIARLMEFEGNTDKTIKMATGWERGADGKWRYEVNDDITAKHIRSMKGAGLKKIQEARSKRMSELDKFMYIVRIVGVDRLYDDKKILATSWPDAQKQNWLKAYEMYKDDREGAIEDIRKASVEYNKLRNLGKGEFILYEVLGNDHSLFKEYPQLRNVNVVLKPYKGGGDRGNYNRLANTITIIDFRGIMENDKGEGSADTLVHEIQHIIQSIEGFARGGNTIMDDPQKMKAKEAEVAYQNEMFEDAVKERNALSGQMRLLNQEMMSWWDNNPDATWEDALADEKMSNLNKQYSDIEKQMEDVRKRVELHESALESAEGIDTSLGFEGYKRLVGEVEARNVERRRNMSLGERRNSPAWETEDVSRKDQIFIEDALGEANAQLRTVKTNYESQFAELQSEYDALDKNDAEVLNEWRDKKADVVRSYISRLSNKFGLKCELYVFNGGREEEMRKAYDTMVEKYKAEGIEKVPSYESFKKKVSNPKVVATHRKSINFVTFNTSADDAELNIEQFAETLFHENAHRITEKMYSEQEFEQIWENAKKSKNSIAKSVEKLYSDKSDAQKGNEFIAKAIGALVSNHNRLFTNYLMGKDNISAEDLVKKLKYSLPLGKLALTETLNEFKNEYQERVLQGSGSSLLGGGRDGGDIEVSERDGGRNRKRDWQGDQKGQRAERRLDVVGAATDLAESLGVKLNVIEDVNEITDSNTRRQRAKRGAKAWYDVNTDQVYFVAPNATSIEDAQMSVLHEVVAHKGLRDVVGRENFDKFLDKVFYYAEKEIRSRIVRLASQNGWNFRVATEEYLASLAEEGFDSRENRTFLQKVRDFFMDMLREAKIAIGFNISDNDMRYMLWRTYQMQKSQGAMAVAEDVVMQQKLGVGNFRTRPAGTRQMTEEEQIIADAKANGTYLKAPNGKDTNLTPKQWAQVRTKAFKKWFGDWENDPKNASKIVDENGEPKVVYHGTPKGGFSIFDTKPKGKTEDTGAWFASDRSNALTYSGRNYEEFATPFTVADLMYLIENNEAYKGIRIKEAFYIKDEEGNEWKYDTLQELEDDGWYDYTSEDIRKEYILFDGLSYIGTYSDEEVGDMLNEALAIAENTETPMLYEVFLNIRDPYTIDAEGKNWQDLDLGSTDATAREGRYAGYDGTIIKNVEDGGDVAAYTTTDYIVHNPNQIKSATENVGTFDSNNDDIRFRATPTPTTIKDGEAKEIRKKYDKKVNTGRKGTLRMTKYNFIEANQDEMRSLKEYQKLVKEAYGIDKLPSYLDVYALENRIGSAGFEKFNRFVDGEYEVMQQFIDNYIAKGGETLGSVIDYARAKSGLERNREFTVRDYIDKEAKAKLITKKEAEEMLEQVNRELQSDIITPTQADARRQQINNMLNKNKSAEEQITAMREQYEAQRDAYRKDLADGQINYAEFNKLSDEYVKKFTGLDVTDYSGLSATAERMGKKANEWKKAAADIVEAFEGKHDNTNEFWSAVKACNDAVIKEVYDSGMISKQLYDHLKEQLLWYIPMSGFTEDVAEDVYSYIGGETGAFTPPVKKASGRLSESDDPFAIIANKMQGAILQGNRNRIKLAFLNLIQSYPTDLVTEGKVWLTKQADGTWEEKPLEIPADTSSDDAAKLIEEYNEEMRSLKKQGLAREHKNKLNVPYVIQTKSHQNDHEIIAYRNGQQYVMYVNGNPQLAKAINGKLKDKGINLFYKLLDKWNRIESANKTSWNPDFIAPNVMRDFEDAVLSTFIDAGVKDAAVLAKTFVAVFPEVVRNISGSENKSGKYAKYFEEFIQNGGETGYSHLHDVEKWKDINQRRWKRLGLGGKALNTPVQAFNGIGSMFSYLNRIAEDSTRFAAYVHSRQKGRTIGESIKAAKDITTNFNKKGSGATEGIWGFLANFMRRWFLFYNPMVQGIYKHWERMTQSRKRYALVFAAMAGAGYLAAVLNKAATDDDDEEKKYFNQSDYTRRTNIMIYTGDGYIKIPLAPVFREMYALGDIMYSIQCGVITPWEGTKEVVNLVRSLFNLEGQSSLKDKEFSWFRFVIPESTEFVADIEDNVTFTGAPLYKDTPWNKFDPEYQKVYNGTWTPLIRLSKAVNDILPHEDYLHEVDDQMAGKGSSKLINPAVWQHIIEDVTGGVGKTVGDVVTIIDNISNDKEIDLYNIPVAKRFYSKPDERTRGRILKNQYYNATDELEYMNDKYKNYTNYLNETLSDPLEKANKIVEYWDSDAGKRHKLIKDSKSRIDKLNRELKEAKDDAAVEEITLQKEQEMNNHIESLKALESSNK